MSYRDLRNFTEMLRALGYPQLISMESFRNPNFQLVSEIIVWLAKRLDPDADIPTEISTEDDRVALIRATAQFMALKVNVKLNTKKLYQADGYAVKELLKVATLLYDAVKNTDKNNYGDEEIDENILSMREFDISDKISDLKQSRQLASEITSNGAALYDLLGKEVDLRSLRHISVGRQFELGEVETGIKQAIQSVNNEIDDTKQLINNVSTTESNLDTKIERRKVEVDRYEKRLQTLKKVKPAFLEEFSKAEQELKELYEQYIVRYRCMMYLEQRFAEVERIETERMQQHLIATRRLVEQLRLEEHLPEENNSSDQNELQDDDDDDEEEQAVKKPERPSNKSRTGTRPLRSSKLYGSMNPVISEVSTGSSSESDSDDMLIDGEEPELASLALNSDDDSMAIDLSPAGGGIGHKTKHDERNVIVERRAPTAASGRKTNLQMRLEDSDDDF